MPASATGIVDRMEQRGLVERRRDDDDRRVVRVALTATGATFGGIAAERRERLAALLDELTEAELDGFLAGLRAMRRGREPLHRLKAERAPTAPRTPGPDA